MKQKSNSEREEFFQQNSILQLIKEGKAAAITAKKLFEIYVQRGGTKNFDPFYRELRLVVEELRRKKIKIVGDNSGFYIAETQKEWDDYMERQRHRIMNELITLCTCSGRTITGLVREWAMKKPSKQLEVTIDLFGDATNVPS